MIRPSNFIVMQKSSPAKKVVLITGGTSGLGLEVVRLYLERGFEVITTGRNILNVNENSDSLKLFTVDFSDLEQTALTALKICENCEIDMIINNAGVLSPPDLIMTRDGLEYTFQVNFLSHLLLNEIIINKTADRKLVIAAVTSPVYRIADSRVVFPSVINSYKRAKAYADSKLFLTLMCEYLSEKYQYRDIKCIGFDPGVFSSRIYRMQNKWFRVSYNIAAPFMRSSRNVALSLVSLLENDTLATGSVYDLRNRMRSKPGVENLKLKSFWDDCYKRIGQFLK